MVAWHGVPGMRKKKEPVPEGRCDYVFVRSSTKIVSACTKFRGGVESGSYTIILSLRDGSLLFTPFQALRARSPSRTTAHPKPSVYNTTCSDRDVGLAESGYSHESLRDISRRPTKQISAFGVRLREGEVASEPRDWARLQLQRSKIEDEDD
jgi:hypothetical protein